MIPPAAPIVSIVICTRNRRDNPVKTIRSVLACSEMEMEILLMDQSDGEETRLAIQPLLDKNAELRYFRLSVPGKPVALNTALEQAQGRYLLLTDDDCEPQPGWIEGMLAGFSNEEIGCIFGAVDPAPHDKSKGYIVYHPVRKTMSAGTMRDVRRIPGRKTVGIGANLAIRQNALKSISGWDPCIGPGTKFRSGDDFDIATRLSLAGYGIGFCVEGRVTHYGFRPWSERFEDTRRFGFGRGAAFVKYLRCGILHEDSLAVLWLYAEQFIKHPWLGVRRPIYFGMAFLAGIAQGMRHPVDRKTYRYHPVDDAEKHLYGSHFANVVLRSELSELSELEAGQEVK
jgi:glycosyltransferase involved in cell wall biosynthesis